MKISNIEYDSNSEPIELLCHEDYEYYSFERMREAQWEEYPNDSFLRCSYCKLEFPKKRMPETRKRCPNCGAYMKGQF